MQEFVFCRPSSGRLCRCCSRQRRKKGGSRSSPLELNRCVQRHATKLWISFGGCAQMPLKRDLPLFIPFYGTAANSAHSPPFFSTSGPYKSGRRWIDKRGQVSFFRGR